MKSSGRIVIRACAGLHRIDEIIDIPGCFKYCRAKAVAHGGVAFYLDRNVTERTMRHTYGVTLRPSYDSSNSEHQARRLKLWTDPISGTVYVEDGFFALVKKASHDA